MLQLKQCPVCGSDDIGHEFSSWTTRKPAEGSTWHIVKCAACNHRFLNPQPSWQELEPFYNAEYGPYDPNHGAEANDEEVLRTARETGSFRHLPLPGNKRLLDVGCGAGFFLRIAKRLGATVQGVEPSEYAAEQARQSGLNVFCGTVEEYADQFASAERFDIITLSHVLEHVPHPVETLATLKRLIAPAGTIWLSVPNIACWSSRKLRAHWHSIDVPYHLQHFSPQSLERCGDLAGLKLKASYTYSLPSALASTIRMYLRRKWLVPRRVSHMIGAIDGVFAPRLATRLDKRHDGEAIVCEFQLNS